jgi:RNA polymerase sigma factor (sigma-70 family)
MAKKRLETTEAVFNELLQDPAYKPLLQPVLQRHPGADQDRTLLFEVIGEDLDCELEVVREEAFWVLKALMPELDEILYVRKRTQEDIIEHLLQVLVTERRFSQEEGKDPRPFVGKIAKNWSRDASRREDRIISLDEPLIEGEEGTALRSLLPNPISAEDEIVDRLFLEQFITGLDFLTKNEKFVIVADLADWPARMIAEELGISENAVRHLRSRARQKIKGHGAIFGFMSISAIFRYYGAVFGRCPICEEVSKKDRALSFIRRTLDRVIGLCLFLRQKMAMFRIKKLHE